MSDHTIDLDAAIVAALKAYAALTAIVGSGGVYGSVPSNAARPYVVVGDTTAIDDGGLDVDAQVHTITVHVWSKPPALNSAAQAISSKRQCLDMVKHVRAALHNTSPTLASGATPKLRCEFTETFRDPDDASHHGVLRFRARTQD